MLEETQKTQKQMEEEAEKKAQVLLESERRVYERQLRQQIQLELEEEYEKKKKEFEKDYKEKYKQQLSRYAQKIIQGVESMTQYDFMGGKIDVDYIHSLNNFDELLETTGKVQKTFLEEAEKNSKKMMEVEWENIERAQRKVNRKWEILNEVVKEQDYYKEVKAEFDRRMEIWNERDDMLYI